MVQLSNFLGTCNYNCFTNGSICGSVGNCDLKQKFDNLISRRTNSTNKRLINFGIEKVSSSVIQRLFINSINSGLICSYCGEKMQLFAPKEDFRMAISIDHIKPLSCGGTNNEDNLVVCCTRCNLVKGTMQQKHFLFILKQLREYLGKKEMLSWLNDSYNHAKAYKIERMRSENG